VWGAVDRNRGLAGNQAEALVRDGKVVSVDASAVGAGQIPSDGFYLVGDGAAADVIRALEPGDDATLTYGLADPVAQQARFAVGHQWVLVENGVRNPNLDGSVNPRTMLGFKDGGKTMILVTVDGRQAPVNGIREGSGNVICLDILRTLRSVPMAGEVLSDMLGQVTGQYRLYDAALGAHMDRFPRLPDEAEARWYAASLATLLTASILIRHAPAAISEAYIATRLGNERGRVPGAISGVDTDAILARLG